MQRGPLNLLVATAVLLAGCSAAIPPTTPTLAAVPTAMPPTSSPTQVPPGATPTAQAATALPTVVPSPTAAPTAALSNGELSARLSWQPTQAPTNGEDARAQWLEIRFHTVTLGERRVLAAVFRPSGDGPFPVVVYPHGASGLSTPMLDWAPMLSKVGFLVLAGCYQLTAPAKDRIACLDGPLTAGEGLAALLQVAHQLPEAKQGAIGVLGLSLGAALTYSELGKRTDIAAAVADSGTPSNPDIRDAANVHAAVLLLASPIDPQTSIAAVQEYERAQRAAGKTVEAHYYPDGSHVVTLSQPTADDATQRTLDFFRRYLH